MLEALLSSEARTHRNQISCSHSYNFCTVIQRTYLVMHMSSLTKDRDYTLWCTMSRLLYYRVKTRQHVARRNSHSSRKVEATFLSGKIMVLSFGNQKEFFTWIFSQNRELSPLITILRFWKRKWNLRIVSIGDLPSIQLVTFRTMLTLTL